MPKTKQNHIEIILKQMQNDDGADQRQSDRLERLYNEASESQKWAIDEALMCICGWCFETIRTNDWTNKD